MARQMMSLKETILRKMVISMWHEEDVFVLMEKFPYHFSDDHYLESWEEIVVAEVKRKISKLVLPEELKKEAMFLVASIGAKIRKWKTLPEYYLLILSNCKSTLKVNV
ncbi:hypothetical protein HNY73_007397 [Argiope bruennichi]|uniref:Uncharacterized protein n=1 Tax=Argiope bruennichi TaxID=94029 RepID=A0A8T0FJC0_ARGBR|nr:hypothetical protein HNY73_007397 [Argiope bruennichi]